LSTKEIDNEAWCGNQDGEKRQPNLYLCSYEAALKSGEKVHSLSHGHGLRAKMNECTTRKQKHTAMEFQTYSVERIKRAGIHSHPTLIVNGKAVYGSLSAENAFNAVCEAFIDPPAACTYVKDKWVMNTRVNELMVEHARREGHFWLSNILVLMVIFSIAGGCFYVIFKKMYKNILGTQIDQMVRESAQNYNKIGDL